jgi:L-lactate dehydrogenase complex protein LldG
MISNMQRAAEQAGARVFHTPGIREVLRRAVDATREMGGGSIACAGISEARQGEMATLCEEAGIRLIRPPFREHLDSIHTGVTPAHFALADTGTLVVDSASEDLRIASMLSELHVVFLAKNCILPDFDALDEKLAPLIDTGGGYTAFITGPSRTADIERHLAIGAHGPSRLDIHLLED